MNVTIAGINETNREHYYLREGKTRVYKSIKPCINVTKKKGKERKKREKTIKTKCRHIVSMRDDRRSGYTYCKRASMKIKYVLFDSPSVRIPAC